MSGEQNPTNELLASLQVSIQSAASSLGVAVDSFRLADIAVDTLQQIEKERIYEPDQRVLYWGMSPLSYSLEMDKRMRAVGLCAVSDLQIDGPLEGAVGLMLWGAGGGARHGEKFFPMGLDLVKITSIDPNEFDGQGRVEVDLAKVEAFEYGTSSPAVDDPWVSANNDTAYVLHRAQRVCIARSFTPAKVVAATSP